MHAALMLAILVAVGIVGLLNRALGTSRKSRTKTPPPSVQDVGQGGSRKRYIYAAGLTEARLRPHIDRCIAQPRSLESSQRLEELLKDLLTAHFTRAVALSTSQSQLSSELRKGTGEVFEQYLSVFRECPPDERAKLVTGIYLNDVAIEFVAIPILLGRTDLAREFASVAMPHLIGVAYVNEMGRALGALIQRRPYQKGELEPLTGIRKHLVLYLELIQAITNGRSCQKEQDAVEASFKRLSTSKRNKDFNFLDPSGYHELDWDCRLAYILEAARSVGGR
jgi:hypothetical protein